MQYNTTSQKEKPTRLERQEEAQKQQRKEREEARRAETVQSQIKDGEAEKRPRTECTESEIDTEGGEEVGRSQSQSRSRKGHMTKSYLTDSDVNFVKDHEELYNKTNEHFKDKTRKECLWERFESSRNL